MIPFVIIGIILLVKSSDETDNASRKSKKKKGIILVVLPFAMIIGSLIFNVLIKIIMALTGTQS